LRAKIRVLEAKRADDARHVRELETRLSEAESFVALRPKLQAKLNSQQTELIATRRELADSQQLSQLAEGRLLDTLEQLEMAMLDKEVAEERADLAEAELVETLEKLAVAEVELGVLKETGSGLIQRIASLLHILICDFHPGRGSGGDAKARDSLAYIQLDKYNERLKEALIRFVYARWLLLHYS
jgi:dynactin 1